MGVWADQVSPWHDVFAAATSASSPAMLLPRGYGTCGW